MEKPKTIIEVKLDKVVGGGRTIGTMGSGQKIFVWGGIPEEVVKVEITKMKSNLAEGKVVEVIKPSTVRILPKDTTSYLSTSPWQIMTFDAEQHYKSALIEEAFELHNIVLPNPIKIYSDNQEYNYRNKLEFSWWWSRDENELNLAFFDRGTHNKVTVNGSSLAKNCINQTALAVRDLMRKIEAKAYDLKTLMIRCDANDKVVAQLYVKDKNFKTISNFDIESLNIQGFEVIYSDPKSPASVITKTLQTSGDCSLSDKLLGIDFNYSVDGFFQINLPVYQKTLQDIRQWIDRDSLVIDLYSGVGTIGLTSGASNLKLVEINESAVSEMKNNIIKLRLEKTVEAIVAKSEAVADIIELESIVIVDPPRAGMHDRLVERIIQIKPRKIIYLSCNPTTQARDVAKLLSDYSIAFHYGYNFFPRTPHIEHLVVLTIK